MITKQSINPMAFITENLNKQNKTIINLYSKYNTFRYETLCKDRVVT